MDDSPLADDPPTTDPRPDQLRTVSSLVVVNTGHGKGKSTAAFGTMLRSLALGWRVAVVQFVKSGDWKVGEQTLGVQLGVDWIETGRGFTWDSANLEHDRALAWDGWQQAEALIAAGEHRLVILDELTYLITWGWLDVEPVVAAIATRPDHVNVVITGRDAHPALVDMADTVTEMRPVKHAYDQGIAAKRGIDY
jgi:cob(I)alamin adenosyltransferase